MFKLITCLMLLSLTAQVSAYETVETKNTSMPYRNRAHLTIVDKQANDKASRIAVIKQAIKETTECLPVKVVTIDLVPSAQLSDSGALLAQGHYFADGCGSDGSHCDGVTFDIKASDITLTEQQIRIWEKVIYTGLILADDNIFDRETINQQVAKSLNIPINEVEIPVIVLD